jgi:hypothetical protein
MANQWAAAVVVAFAVGGCQSEDAAAPDGSSSGIASGSSSTTQGESTGSSSGGALEDFGLDETGPVVNGDYCFHDDDCRSGRCWWFFVTQPEAGGVCSECLVDADCSDGGCTPLTLCTVDPCDQNPDDYARCNQGELGAGCQSDEVCQQGLSCVPFYAVPDLVPHITCSACEADADCGSELCVPTYLAPGLAGGYRSCVAPASVPLGAGCDPGGSGDAACASGICETVTLIEGVTAGVCSQCRGPRDCPRDETCRPGSFDLHFGPQPGICQTR